MENDTDMALVGELENAFNAAMVSNDPAQIRQCVADDWTMVTPERGPFAADMLIGIIESGVLSHDTMTKDISHVKREGDILIVTGRCRNSGAFRGEPIAADEWVTDLYRRVEDKWLCFMTQLTPAKAVG